MDNVSFAIVIARAMGSNRNSHPSGGLSGLAPLLLLSGLIGHHSDEYRTPLREYRTPFRRLEKVSDMNSESLSDINRNGCPIWIGTSVRFESESVSDMRRNTQLAAPTRRAGATRRREPDEGGSKSCRAEVRRRRGKDPS